MGREKPHGGFEPPLIWFCLILIQNVFLLPPFPLRARGSSRHQPPLYVQPGILLTVKRSHCAPLLNPAEASGWTENKLYFCPFPPHSAAEFPCFKHVYLYHKLIFPTFPSFLYFIHPLTRQAQETLHLFRFQFTRYSFEKSVAVLSHF